MQVIDLHIHPDFKKWLVEASEDKSLNLEVFLVVRGPVNDEGPDSWGMTVISKEMADETKKDKRHAYVRMDDIVFLTIQPELVHELEGKFMDWNQDGPRLIDRV